MYDGKAAVFDAVTVHLDEVETLAPGSTAVTEISAGLRNREFTINLPIVFSIERKGG